jgi:hypothetical protein
VYHIDRIKESALPWEKLLNISGDTATVHKAILETFKNRATPLKDRMFIFAEEFKHSKEKQTQWSAFLRRSRLDSFKSFAEAVEHLEQFIEPACSKLLLSKHDIIWKPEVWEWQ